MPQPAAEHITELMPRVWALADELGLVDAFAQCGIAAEFLWWSTPGKKLWQAPEVIAQNEKANSPYDRTMGHYFANLEEQSDGYITFTYGRMGNTGTFLLTVKEEDHD